MIHRRTKCCNSAVDCIITVDFIKPGAVVSHIMCGWQIWCDEHDSQTSGWSPKAKKETAFLFFLLEHNNVIFWNLMHFTCRRSREKVVMCALGSALFLPLTSVSWVWSSAIFLSYIIFLSDTMAIRLNRISPSLYLKEVNNTILQSIEWYTVRKFKVVQYLAEQVFIHKETTIFAL